jgi:plasmid stabilization system protein ParE
VNSCPTMSLRKLTNAIAHEGSVHSACIRRTRENLFVSEARNPQTARRVVGLIMQRIHELGSEPYKGRPTDRGGLFTL